MKTCSHLLTASVAALAMSMALPAAHAEFPTDQPYVGVFGGGHLLTRDWDLGDPALKQRHLGKSGAEVGLRLGYQLYPFLSVEAGLGYLPVPTDLDGTASVLQYDLNAYLHLFPKADWSPFVLAGFGAYHAVAGDLGADVDPITHLGVGIRAMVLPWLAVRADLRSLGTDGDDELGAYNIALNAGVDLFFVQKPAAAAPPPDADGDGIADAEDDCPDTAGTKELNGCAE